LNECKKQVDREKIKGEMATDLYLKLRRRTAILLEQPYGLAADYAMWDSPFPDADSPTYKLLLLFN